MSGSRKTFFAFLAGAIAGAVAGLLLAPDSGKNTRKKLADKAKDIKDKLEDQLGKFGNNG